MLQDLEDPDWIRKPALDPALNAIAAEGLVFDALILPHQVGAIIELAARHPQLSIVLDHGAKPKLGNGEAMAAWTRDIGELAQAPNVVCKVSGLLTELPSGGSRDDVIDAIHVLFDRFGPNRLLWGSDWPVLTLAGDYHDWFELAREVLAARQSSAVRAVMGDNALRIYRPRRQGRHTRA
jgi:L-fuconolactonase